MDDNEEENPGDKAGPSRPDKTEDKGWGDSEDEDDEGHDWEWDDDEESPNHKQKGYWGKKWNRRQSWDYGYTGSQFNRETKRMGLLVKLEASERECKKLRKESAGEGSGISWCWGLYRLC